jgi:hypothetical protein
MNNTNVDEATHILSLLEIGSRIDAAHLKELEAALSVSLRSGRHFGTKQGFPESSDLNWQGNWDNVEKILNRTQVWMSEMEGGLASHASGHLERATVAWEAIQCEGDLLQEALGTIRMQTTEMNSQGRQEWNLLAHTLESQLEAVHFCAEALRIKLELQKGNSREAAEGMVQDIVSKLPKRNHKAGSEDALYDHEFRKAAIDLQREHHEFLGFMDLVKGMLMWTETPDTRMRKNRSLSVRN